MDINDKIILLAKNLMIADGLMLSGVFVDKEFPNNSIVTILENQTPQVRNKCKRRYRKMKKFIMRHHPDKIGNKINMANEIKMHYIRKAKEVLNDG